MNTLSRRHALGVLGLGAGSCAALSACGPADGGYGDAGMVPANGGEVPLDSLPENTTTLVKFDGKMPYVAVVRGTGNDISGMSAYCTHQGCAVTKSGGELDCPCHGSRFDERTGAVLQGPAESPLPPVRLEVVDGAVRRAS